jgi:hypothetical protein
MASTINPTAFNTDAFNAIALDPNATRLSHTFVDVSQAAPAPTIVRDGKAVAPPAFNPTRVDDLISHAVPLVRTQVPVAVSQSIPAGTRVAKGTPVDLVLMPVTQIPFTVFTQFHPDLQTKNVSDLLPVVADPQVAPLLDLDPSALTSTQKTVITTALTAKGVNVVETDTSRNFAAAFQSLQSVRVFL